jgi:nucleotide-binding universal stress UspA family protein
MTGMQPAPGRMRRIVVGIDGSEPSKAALRWAVDQAVLTGATVHAVAAWEYPSLYGWFAPMVDEGFEQAARRTLTAEVDEIAGPSCPVPVRESLVLGHAAAVAPSPGRCSARCPPGARCTGPARW